MFAQKKIEIVDVPGENLLNNRLEVISRCHHHRKEYKFKTLVLNIKDQSISEKWR